MNLRRTENRLQCSMSRFEEPIKYISDLHADFSLFPKSPGAREVFELILQLNQAVVGISVSSVSVETPSALSRFIQALERMHSWIADIPPTKQERRFGNKSFRSWLDRVALYAQELLGPVIGPELERKGALVELVPYFLSSFGDKTRIDYGSGHELTFVALICCLVKLGVFSKEDFSRVVLKLFKT